MQIKRPFRHAARTRFAASKSIPTVLAATTLLARIEVSDQFAPELARLDDVSAERLTDAILLVTSADSSEAQTDQLNRSVDSVTATWRGIVRTLLDSATAGEPPDKGTQMTISPKATIERTSDGGHIRFERTLAFPIEDVWAALTEPDRMGDWWPPMAAEITVDLHEGGSIVFDWPDIDFPTMEFTIARLQPQTLLEHTHTSPGSWMRWELESIEGGTRLRATYAVPDLDMAIERGDLVGLHYSLDRLVPALSGQPVGWDMDAFTALRQVYDEPGQPSEA